MEKKIVLALDDSIQSKYAVQYAVDMSSSIMKLHYVLFHIQPGVSQFLVEEAKKSAKTRKELNQLVRKNTKKAEQMLEAHKNEMVRKGISEDRLEIITHPKKRGVAKDILDFAQGGSYFFD